VFHESNLVVVTTEAILHEVRKYLGGLSRKYERDPTESEKALGLLPIEVYGELDYRSHLPEATRYLAKRDPDDIALAALALKLSIPIWSNDKDFRVVPVALYPTAKLLKVLGL